MAKMDRVLEAYDLAVLERAIQNHRDREHRRLVAMVEKLREDVAALASRRPVVGAAGKPLRRPNARRLNDISLAEALVKVMEGRKKPIHYKDLTDTVVKRKLYRTNSRNLLSTVAVTLKRDGRFRKVEPGYYSLR